jgi:hypothetical protein
MQDSQHLYEQLLQSFPLLHAEIAQRVVVHYLQAGQRLQPGSYWLCPSISRAEEIPRE